MINADRELAQIRERNRRKLSAIFGAAYNTMSEEALAAAEAVLMWVDGLSSRYDEAAETIRKRKVIVGIISGTVREYAGETLYASVVGGSQERQAADLRAMMYRMVYELTTIPKSKIAKALCTGQDHSTVHAALRRADDLHLADRTYRETYDMLIARVRKRIEEAEGDNTNHSSCQQ